MSDTPRPTTTDPWTTRRLLAWISGALARKGIESPRLCAELLLTHVIGGDRLRLYTDPDRPASPLERDRLRDLVGRALNHEPLQYLIGEWRFFGMDFRVDRRALIPRPATETIVEHVLTHARAQPGFGGAGTGGGGEGLHIADIGTGSGCIAVALAAQLPGARIVATDTSAEALDLARENAVRHGVNDRIDFLAGDLLSPLSEHPPTRGKPCLHYLVSNPPYIPDDEWAAVPPNVQDHEPVSALRGGEDGLRFVRQLIQRGPDLLHPGGLLLVETATTRAAAALELLRAQHGMADAKILPDFEGLPRVVAARRKP